MYTARMCVKVFVQISVIDKSVSIADPHGLCAAGRIRVVCAYYVHSVNAALVILQKPSVVAGT